MKQEDMATKFELVEKFMDIEQAFFLHEPTGLMFKTEEAAQDWLTWKEAEKGFLNARSKGKQADDKACARTATLCLLFFADKIAGEYRVSQITESVRAYQDPDAPLTEDDVEAALRRLSVTFVVDMRVGGTKADDLWFRTDVGLDLWHKITGFLG